MMCFVRMYCFELKTVHTKKTITDFISNINYTLHATPKENIVVYSH